MEEMKMENVEHYKDSHERINAFLRDYSDNFIGLSDEARKIIRKF